MISRAAHFPFAYLIPKRMLLTVQSANIPNHIPITPNPKVNAKRYPKVTLNRSIEDIETMVVYFISPDALSIAGITNEPVQKTGEMIRFHFMI